MVSIRDKNLKNFFDEKIFLELEKKYLYIIRIPSQGEKMGLRLKKFLEDLKEKIKNLEILFKKNYKFLDRKNKVNEVDLKIFDFLGIFFHDKFLEFFKKDFNLEKIERIENKIKIEVYSKKLEEIKMKSNPKFVIKKSNQASSNYKKNSKKGKVVNNSNLMSFFRKK